MIRKCHNLLKPDKSLAGIYVVTCGAALVSSAILLRLNHARGPQFLYLLPLAILLLWSLYCFMTGKSATLELLERVDKSAPLPTPSARLEFLRELRNSHRLTEAEYQEQRRRILEQVSKPDSLTP